jgi:hypothetical protein
LRGCAMLLRSGHASMRCSVCRFDPGGLQQLRPAPGTGLECPETGGQTLRYRDLSRHQRPQAPRFNRENARKLRAVSERPGNVGSHWTAWWAREKSQLCGRQRLTERCGRLGCFEAKRLFSLVPAPRPYNRLSAPPAHAASALSSHCPPAAVRRPVAERG